MSSNSPNSRPFPNLPPWPNSGLFWTGLVFAVPFFCFCFVWVFCRLELEQGKFAVLIRKTGQNPPSGAILAEAGQKGIQMDVLTEGRHFLNPYTWSWEVHQAITIPAGKLGVMTRLFGSDLASGEIIARSGSKGIMEETLQPGTYRINPHAFNVEIFDAINIRPGHVGVQVSLTGKDPLIGGVERKNTFIVPNGTKGVIEPTLDPATHYLNPYLLNVVEVNLQSQRFEMSGEDAIDFLTADGFPVKVEGTVEYAIRRDQAALLTHEVGDMEDVLNKIILPHARGFARIEGSKGPALNYIVGEMRQQFQDRLEAHLQETCKKWGIDIRSVLIRNITPPEEIAKIIREKEIASQTRASYAQQIEQAKSKAQLVRQEKLAEQNSEKVRAETILLQAKILAQQEQEVRLTAASQRLEVAKLQKQTAEAQAAAVRAEAGGKQRVIQLQNEADALVLTRQAEAFGGGLEYARYLFLQKTAPQIQSILADDAPTGLGGIFNSFLLPEKK